MTQTIQLRRGPSAQDTYGLVESDSRFVVHFQSDLPGGSAAKSALRLPLMFGKRVHARKVALPPGLALFEVRPDEAQDTLPAYTDSVEEMRDAVMNYVRSSVGRQGGHVAACYHTYQRAAEASAGHGSRDNEIFPSGQLFLEFHAEVPEEEQRRLLEHYRLLVDRAITYWRGAFVVSVTQETGTSPVRLAKELQGLTFQLGDGGTAQVFDYADPLFHRRREFQAMPTDGLFRMQWHLRNDGFGGGKAGADIGAPEAWDFTRGHPEIKIAVIDDGFELGHPEIGTAGRAVAPLDVMRGTDDPSPVEGADQWHGTSVLGLICAAHNGKGACGVAPLCHFIPIQLEALSDDEAEARAFDHAVDNGAAVINCSWGPYDGYSNQPWPIPRIVALAIEHAHRNHVAVVFAAGNGCEKTANDGYASHPSVIAVAASTDENKRAYYSDYGDAVWVCAPSSGGTRDIVTTDVAEGGFNPLGGFSGGFGGTSSSAPLVSGIIGLMQSAIVERDGPGHRLSVEQVKRILRDTAEKIDPDGQPFLDYWTREPVSVAYKKDADGHLRSQAYGFGLVNAARAVRAALAEPATVKVATTAAERRAAGRPEGKGPGKAKALVLRAREVGDPLEAFHARRTKMSAEAKKRFEAGEHAWLGDRGFQLAFESAELRGRIRYDDYKIIARRDRTEQFRYGELVALSGDFYASPGDLYWEKRGALTWLWEKNDLSDIREGFAKELATIKAQQKGRVEYPDNNIAFWWNAKSYVELALDNNAHFGWHNLRTYCKHHKAAIEYALRAREVWNYDQNKARELWGEALFTNAFADHFLTDGFAAGHVRVPRQQIRAWSLARGWDEKVAGALSKLLHDQDGHISTVHGEGHALNEADGLPVRNSLGQEWDTRCDGQLFIEHKDEDLALAAPVEAVRRSVVDLLRAHLDGVRPQGVYRALELVPFPRPGSPGLADKFHGMKDAQRAALLEAVQWYVKIPYISTGLNDTHLKEMFAALPSLMGDFRAAVAKEVAESPELAARIPPALIEAYKGVR
jgi:subtilisin family serine protease